MLSVFTIEQSTEWDAVVRSFKQYDTYHLSGYVKAFSIHGDGVPLMVYYEGSEKTGDADIRGINVVMKRDIADDENFKDRLNKNEMFDLSSPYGYAGWLMEGTSDTTSLFAEYGDWCRRQSIVAEFVRYYPLGDSFVRTAKDYDVIALGHTIAMDLSSPETIWQGITPKNRNMIRKAIKNGVVIRTARNEQIFEVFREIYNATMEKDQASPYYYFSQEFYKSILNDLPYNAQVFYAEYEGKIIAASIMLAANGYMNYHLSGSLRDYQHLAPTNLLLYEAAMWGYANGCRTLYLGGGVGSGEDSLYKFKKSFYRYEPCRFYIGKKIWDPIKYEQLIAMRSRPVERDFFPLYRA